MNIREIIDEIRVDLGTDINSLGISDETIEIKIKESIRKISMYAPCVKSGYFPVVASKVVMPEDTIGVLQVLNQTKIHGANGDYKTLYNNDTDLFAVSRYLYNYNELSDPFIFLMQKNQVNTLQNFVCLNDWNYEATQNTLYINNFSGTTISLVYTTKYTNMEDIRDLDTIQAIKEYSLALCKIIEGQIRRKLQSAPGAIQMDGDALVSEGTAEKQRLDEWLPRRFTNLRFGLRV